MRIEWGVIIACVLSCHALASDAAPKDASGWADLAQQHTGALALAAAISSDVKYDRAILQAEIAAVRAIAGQKEPALTIARKLQAEASTYFDELYGDDVRMAAIEVMILAGASDEAERRAGTLAADYRPSVSAMLAAAQHRAGDVEGYRKRVEAATALLQTLASADEADLDWGWYDLITAQKDVGDFDGAKASLARIEAAADRTIVLCDLVIAMAHRGEMDKAKATLAEAKAAFEQAERDAAKDEDALYDSDSTRSHYGRAVAATGDFAAAEAELKTLRDREAEPTESAYLIAALARYQAPQDKAAALKRFDEALAMTLTPKEVEDRSYYAFHVWMVGYHAACADQLDWAHAKLATITDPMMKANLCSGVATALAEKQRDGK